MAGKILWGWDDTNKKWVKLQVDSSGHLKVDMSNIDLGDLGDVDVSGVADGDFFYYDLASGLWKPRKLVDADIPASIARDTEVTAAVAAHAALTTGVHGAGANTILHSGSTDVIGGAQLTQVFGASSARLKNVIMVPKSGYCLRINNAAPAPFAAVINGAPTATTVVYDGETNEDSLKGLVAYDGDSYWGRIVLYNTTKGNERLLEAINLTTNTITTESSSDDWADDDVITILCPTIGDAISFTIDLSTKIAATVVGMIVELGLADNEGNDDVARYVQLQPYEAYDAGKSRTVVVGLANELAHGELTVPVISQRLGMRVAGGCADVRILLRVCATYEYADT